MLFGICTVFLTSHMLFKNALAVVSSVLSLIAVHNVSPHVTNSTNHALLRFQLCLAKHGHRLILNLTQLAKDAARHKTIPGLSHIYICIYIYILALKSADPSGREFSKAWVCSRSTVGIAGSNPARGMDVCLL